MYINQLKLMNFRNISNLKLELNDAVNILYGKNAQGKTNVLESIYICATGHSHRTHVDRELIQFNEKNSHIKVTINKDNRTNCIDVHLKKDEKKGIAVNNIAIKKLGELFGILNIVMFSPEDLELIKSGPSTRRKFMDLQLCQLNAVYYYNLQQYYRALKQRNILLKNIVKNKNLIDSLFVWDNQIIDFGEKLIHYRSDFIKKINKIAKEKHKILSGNSEILKIEYSPNCSFSDLKNKINKSHDRDILYGTTTVGPHKDDINFFINENDVRTYASQGQQRTAALSAKMSEIDLIIEETEDTPILLLDDVLSELDTFRQRFLLSSIKGIQVIMTCTDKECLLDEQVTKKNLYYVENGIVTP